MSRKRRRFDEAALERKRELRLWNEQRQVNVAAAVSRALLFIAYLSIAHLIVAYLSKARLFIAYLSITHLIIAYLSKARLFKACLSIAHLSKAHLFIAYLSIAHPSTAHLSISHLSTLCSQATKPEYFFQHLGLTKFYKI